MESKNSPAASEPTAQPQPSHSKLIRPAEFGLIADYLTNPRSPIHFLLHVSSRAMLGVLGEQLAHPRHVDPPPWEFPEPVEQALQNGSIFISSRLTLSDRHSVPRLDHTTIPRQTLCHVIYSPPFYLVHTPGLFERTLVLQQAAQKNTVTQRPAPKNRIKF